MSLRRQILRSGGWVVASTGVLAAAQILQLVALARILGPQEYGGVAVLVLVQSLVEMLMTSAVSNAIIQRQSAALNELSSLHGLNSLIGLVAGVCLAAFSPSVGVFFNNPEVVTPVALMGLAVFISSRSHVRRACLERDMDFRLVAIVETTAGGFTVAAVVLATLLMGLSGVCFGIISGTVLRNGLFWWVTRKTIHLRFRLVFGETKRFLSFGLLQFMNSFVGFVDSNTATILIGRGLSSVELGGYNLAYSVSVNIPGKLNPVITRVMFPALSKVQDDSNRFGAATLQLITLAGLVNLPFLLVLMIAAPILAPLVFGLDWAWAAGLMQILAVAGYTRALGNPLGVVLMAKDRQGLGLAINVVKTVLSITIMYFFIQSWGVTGAVLALVLSGVITIFINQFLLRHLLSMRFRTIFWAHLQPMVIGLVPALIGIVLSSLSTPQSPRWETAAGIATGVIVPFALIVWFARVPAVQAVVGARKNRNELPAEGRTSR